MAYLKRTNFTPHWDILGFLGVLDWSALYDNLLKTFEGRWLHCLRSCHLDERTPCHARHSQVCVVCVRRIGEPSRNRPKNLSTFRSIKDLMTQSLFVCFVHAADCLRLQMCHHDDVLMYVPGSSRFHNFSVMAPGSAVNCDGFASISSFNCIHGKYAGRRGQRTNGPPRLKISIQW